MSSSHIPYGGVLGRLSIAILSTGPESACLSVSSSILGIKSAVRNGFDTTSSC